MTDTITKQEPKLSVRKPGVWRNKWTRAPGFDHVLDENDDGDQCTPLGDGSWLGGGRHLSESDAVARAMEDMEFNERNAQAVGLTGGIYAYLGPVFFPEGDDA